MEHPNIYTFKHSALPAIDDAIKGEIAEIDFNVTNLLLKFQGHYRALSELRETLSDLLDSCDLNLQSIRIIPDGNSEEDVPRAINLTDLSTEEKHLIISTGITSTVAIKMLASALNCEIEEALEHVAVVGQAAFASMTPESREASIRRMVEALRENYNGHSFLVEV
ncbi:hypothetical protein QUA42_24300 [Microcoleus sp. Pol11C2]|uniref:hypothetical protein n=1 Tax=Microcoleus sp. Pol11C2 TaxID=3055389 RepID=UPI002FD082EC